MKNFFFSTYFPKKFLNPSLCLVTDRIQSLKSGHKLSKIVETSIKNGCTMVQYREKDPNYPYSMKLSTALELKSICNAQKIPLIINDDINLAKSIDADGVHIGQSDKSINDVKSILNKDAIIGVTVSDSKMAKEAIEFGADYLGTDAIYESQCKPGKSIGLDKLKEIVRSSNIPVIGIGGINNLNIKNVINCGVDGVAVISHIVGANDPGIATKELVEEIHKGKEIILKEKIGNAMIKLKKKKPLILHITNSVVTNISANITLCIGSSPLMSSEEKDVEDLISISDAILINIGTINEKTAHLMMYAGKKANLFKKPVILDPVGIGASLFRQNVCQDLIKEIKFDIIKGNGSEIKFLLDQSEKQKGVDSIDYSTQSENIVFELSRKLNGTIIIMTGKFDYISNGINVLEIQNNCDMLQNITGSGCMVGSLISSFAGGENDLIIAGCAGVGSMTIAAENIKGKFNGPGSFHNLLFDSIYNMSFEMLRDKIIIKILK